MKNRNFEVLLKILEALHGMEAVAEHINEMQKIYDEYGSVFDELSKHYKDASPQSKVRHLLYCQFAASRDALIMLICLGFVRFSTEISVSSNT